MAITPLEIKRNREGNLVLKWSDGAVHVLPSEVLRRNCPCAVCLEKRGDTSHAKPLTGRRSLAILDASKDEETGLEKIWPVGGYAIGMLWKDKHDSGIYTYGLLRQLGERSTSSPEASAGQSSD